MTADDIAAALRGQFDVDLPTALGWLNERYREAVATAHWLKEVVALATTVAGQGAYDVPAGYVDVIDVYVDAGDGPANYSRVGIRDLWDLKAARLSVSGSGGVFAPMWRSDGTQQVEFYPAPTQAGLTVTALVAAEPTDLTLGMSPNVPVDLHAGLHAGARSIGFLREEERPELAQPEEQIFQTMVEALRRRVNSRVGSGPVQIGVAGYHFRQV